MGRAELILLAVLAVAPLANAIPASGADIDSAEEMSYRIVRDRPEDPVRLQLLESERVAYEYTPEASVMFLIEIEDVLIPEYGRPVLMALWQMGVQSQLLILIDPQQVDPQQPDTALVLELWSAGEIHYEVDQGRLTIDYEIVNPETGEWSDKRLQTIRWPE